MTAHIDADGLAEYSAGLVAGRPRRAIAAHLSGCAECGALAAQLAEVSVLLAAVPLPPAPDALIQRLDLALAAEYAERPLVPVQQTRLARLRGGVLLRGGALRGGISREGAVQRGGAWLRGSGRGGWSWRLLAPVTAVAVLAAGGYGLSLLGSGPGASPAVSGGADVAGGGSPAFRAAGNAPAAAPAATSARGEHMFAPAEPSGKLSVVDSGNDYQPATLAAELSVQLHAGLTGAPATAGVAACVVRVADGAHPALVERARYLGAPVLVVVVPTSASDHSYQARLAGSACSATDSDIVAEAVLPSGISAP